MDLLVEALGARALQMAIDFESSDVRIANLSTVVAIKRPHVDLADPRYAQIHAAALRARRRLRNLVVALATAHPCQERVYSIYREPLPHTSFAFCQ